MSAIKEDNGRKSSMRVAVYWTIAMAAQAMAALWTILIIQAYKGNEVDLIGAAAVIGAIGVFMTGVLFGKAHQKGKETKI